MTKREAYVFGWVYAYIEAKLPEYDKSGFKFQEAAQNPLLGFGKINSAAIAQQVLTDEDREQIQEAVDEIEIDSVEDTNSALPLPLQGSWQLGYYHCKAGQGLCKEGFDIKAARVSKRITQVQLAEMMDVDQGMISRWESGKVRPNALNLEKLRKILA